MRVFNATLTLTVTPANKEEIIKILPHDELGKMFKQLLTSQSGIIESEVELFDYNALLSLVLLVAHYEGGVAVELNDLEQGDIIQITPLMKMDFAIVHTSENGALTSFYIVPYKGVNIQNVLEMIPYDGMRVVEFFLKKKDSDFHLYSAWLELVDSTEFAFGATIKKRITVFERPIEIQMRISGKLMAYYREMTPNVPLKDYSFKIPIITLIETSFRPQLIKAI